MSLRRDQALPMLLPAESRSPAKIGFGHLSQLARSDGETARKRTPGLGQRVSSKLGPIPREQKGGRCGSRPRLIIMRRQPSLLAPSLGLSCYRQTTELLRCCHEPLVGSFTTLFSCASSTLAHSTLFRLVGVRVRTASFRPLRIRPCSPRFWSEWRRRVRSDYDGQSGDARPHRDSCGSISDIR
jgi:hypothetical protein